MTHPVLQAIRQSRMQGDMGGICQQWADEITQLPRDMVPELVGEANQVRKHFKGQVVFTCGIVNAKSGRCSEDCRFCAQSGHHETGVQTYPLYDESTLVAYGLSLFQQGATRYSMVSSGLRLSRKELDVICKAAETVRSKTGMTLCASLGTLTSEMAHQLRDSGITNYHHNLECARSFFPNVCTTHDYEMDIETVHIAAEAGLRVCCGGIFGLGESWQQRVELAMTIRSLPVASVPLNFLNPIPGTPMEHRPRLHPMDALKSIALVRLILPDRDITICGGREVTLKDFQSWIFPAGANGVMVGNYLTTQGRNIEMDMEMIRDSGLTLETDVPGANNP